MKKVIIITCLLFTCLLQAQVLKYKIHAGIVINEKGLKERSDLNTLLVYNKTTNRISIHGDTIFHGDVIEAIEVDEDKDLNVFHLKIIHKSRNIEYAIWKENKKTKEVFLILKFDYEIFAYEMYRIEN